MTPADFGTPVNDRNVRCWCSTEGGIEFAPHIDLEARPGRWGAGGVTFPDSLPEGTVEAIRRLQDDHALLTQRVWELEDQLGRGIE